MTPDTGMKSDRGLDFDKEVLLRLLLPLLMKYTREQVKNLYLLAILK
jgi:hypothetical protein